jgi:hypothetical protein
MNKKQKNNSLDKDNDKKDQWLEQGVKEGWIEGGKVVK